MCKTRYEWTLIDFATWFAGAVLVPIYETSSPAQVQWNLDRLRRHRGHRRDARPLRPLRRGAPRAPGDPQHLADRPRRPRQARGVRHRRHRRGDRAPPQPRRRLRHRDAHLHVGLDRQAEGLRAHPLELRRDSAATRPWRSRRSSPTPTARRRCSSSPPRTSSRASSRCSSVHAGVRVGHQPDTKQLLPSLGSFKPTFLLAVPRVFEKVYNVVRAEGRGRRQGQDLPRRCRHRRRPLEAPRRPARSRSASSSSSPSSTGSSTASSAHAMGGNVEYAVSGSAPLGPRLGHFYHASASRSSRATASPRPRRPPR